MDQFTAFRIDCSDGACRTGLEQLDLDDLSPGDVLIRSAYSGINYKDALAATGTGRILKVPALVGGIDVAGVVETSVDPGFSPGDAVIVCGCGLSETRDGGYAGFVRVPASCVVRCPGSISLFEAMAIGSAGFSAALAIDNMQRNRQRPELGAVAVTGATGGVGSFAIDLLAGQGFEVCAVTGKPAQADYLQALGAKTVIDRRTLETGDRPLLKAVWGGAIDSAGGEILSWLTRSVRAGGNIAAVGLAAGAGLSTSVMPFILRGVNLLGTDSVNCGSRVREHIWKRLATDLRPRAIERIVTRRTDLQELPEMFPAYVQGQVTGRCVVELDTTLQQRVRS